MSPRIPQRDGRHSNYARPFRLIKSRAICSAIAVAADLRGARDRFDPARVPGPYDRLWRIVVASNAFFLLLLLSPNQTASCVGEGRAGASADPGTGARASGRSAPSWRIAPPLRTTHCLKDSAQPSIGSVSESSGLNMEFPVPTVYRTRAKHC